MTLRPIDQNPRSGALGRQARTLSGLSMCMAGLFASSGPAALGMRGLAVSFLITWTGALILCSRKEEGLTSAASIYIVVFGLFHGGLIVAYAVIGQEALVGSADNLWVDPFVLRTPVEIVNLAMIGLALGVRFAPKTRFVLDDRVGRLARRLGPAGTGMAFVGLILLTRLFASGGGAFLSSGYGQVLVAVDGKSTFGYASGQLFLGLAFMVSAGGKFRRYAFILFGLICCIALPLGLRGEVLFPALVILMIEGRRRKLSTPVIAFSSVFVLALISLLRETRAEGISGLTNFKEFGFSPLQGLAEMGYSIYPVVVVENWMESGDKPMNGVTLIAPLIRAAEGLFGTAAPVPDFRLFHVEIASRVGPIGGSPVAEGLRNGGVVFAILLLVGIGLIVGSIDKLPSNPQSFALAAVALIPLLIQVRNGFSSVPVQWIIGLTILLVLRYWPDRRAAARPRNIE